jgi:hypothetical protein
LGGLQAEAVGIGVIEQQRRDLLPALLEAELGCLLDGVLRVDAFVRKAGQNAVRSPPMRRSLGRCLLLASLAISPWLRRHAWRTMDEGATGQRVKQPLTPTRELR